MELARIVSDDESAGSEEREELRDGGLADEINDRQVPKSAPHPSIGRRTGDCHLKAPLQKLHRQLSIVLERPPAPLRQHRALRSPRPKNNEVCGRTLESRKHR